MTDRRLGLPAAAPCGSCPYRTDVPSGVWHPTEYEKLPKFAVQVAAIVGGAS